MLDRTDSAAVTRPVSAQKATSVHLVERWAALFDDKSIGMADVKRVEDGPARLDPDGGLREVKRAISAGTGLASDKGRAPSYPGAVVDLGDAGASVRAVQQRLNAELGGADLTVDGKFGARTEKAVERFQKANGLAVDGKVGPKSWAALFDDKPVGMADVKRAEDGPARPAPDRGGNKGTDGGFFVEKIPEIMRNMGGDWNVAASFQEKWLESDAAIAHGNVSNVIEQVERGDLGTKGIESVSVSWILKDSVDTNGRAEKAFNKLRDPEHLFSRKAEGELAKTLKEQLGNDSEIDIEFKDILKESSNISFLNSLYVQVSSVETGLPPTIDPLTGALGNFSFYGIPLGRAEKLSDDEVKFTPTGVAIYAVDTFEFNNGSVLKVGIDQDLGYWREPDEVTWHPNGNTSEHVTNNSYNFYRQQTGYGGDFLIRSDVVAVSLTGSVRPFIVDIS